MPDTRRSNAGMASGVEFAMVRQLVTLLRLAFSKGALRVFLIGGKNGIILQCSGLQNGLLRKGTLNQQGFSLTFSGEADKVYQVQYSTNVIDWNDLFQITNSTGTVQLFDTNAALQGQRFYRVLFSK